LRRVVLYGRPDCHLCDEARAILSALVARAGDVELAEVDIEADDGLFREYLERIPVVELDGRVISELVPDAPSLAATLLQPSAR
jgi:glutaredoxin